MIHQSAAAERRGAAARVSLTAGPSSNSSQAALLSLCVESSTQKKRDKLATRWVLCDSLRIKVLLDFAVASPGESSCWRCVRWTGGFRWIPLSLLLPHIQWPCHAGVRVDPRGEDLTSSNWTEGPPNTCCGLVKPTRGYLTEQWLLPSVHADEML